jgi:hypothetical protein
MQAIEKAYLSSDSDTEHQVDRAHRQQKLRRAQDEQARATLTDSVLREPAGAALPGGIASLRRNSSAASTPTSATAAASAAAAAAASVSAVASEADSAVARAASLSSVGVEMTVPTPRTRKPLPPVSRGVSFSSDASAGSARPASASASVPERAPVFPRVHEGSALAADQHGSEDEPAAPPADDDADDSTLRSRKNGRMSVVYVSTILLSFACRCIRRF